jgi:hypothetical protein
MLLNRQRLVTKRLRNVFVDDDACMTEPTQTQEFDTAHVPKATLPTEEDWIGFQHLLSCGFEPMDSILILLAQHHEAMVTILRERLVAETMATVLQEHLVKAYESRFNDMLVRMEGRMMIRHSQPSGGSNSRSDVLLYTLFIISCILLLSCIII